MIERKTNLPNIQKILSPLKDFQLNTVEYVFDRLYGDQLKQFLIADEVGLGKTLVARGIIAKAVEYLWEIEKRIDIIYICSNLQIARQNISRLNITGEKDFQHTSRATLLPLRLKKLNEADINFVSLTPNTSFNLVSQTGWAYERVMLYYMLRGVWKEYDQELNNILRGEVILKNWCDNYRYWVNPNDIDDELHLSFINALNQRDDLQNDFLDLVNILKKHGDFTIQSQKYQRNRFIGSLRELVAETSMSALEPDLVILDEFQRFKYLLSKNTEIAKLANQLFEYPKAKVLLLSATPYKMYSMYGEEGENHAEDLKHTVRFLLQNNEEEFRKFEESLTNFRRAFFQISIYSSSINQLLEAKGSLENTLRQIMVRTEKLAVSEDRNGMLFEFKTSRNNIRYRDLVSYVYLDKIASILNAGDQVEYWKSSSYPINLMENYKLKKQFRAVCGAKPSENMYDILKLAHTSLLDWEDIQEYRKIDSNNARLRTLMELSIDTNNWKLLWMPPSLPYYQVPGVYCNVDQAGLTKTLIFSAWQIVPKVISVILSYEAERNLLDDVEKEYKYDEFTTKRRSLLNFAYSNERLTGMPVLGVIYPCATLANLIDPLQLIIDFCDEPVKNPPSLLYFFYHPLKTKVGKLLFQATSDIEYHREGKPDERWYWAALAILDRHFNFNLVSIWLNAVNEHYHWSKLLTAGDNSEEQQDSMWFTKHIDEFTKAFNNPNSLDLGPQPKDLENILAAYALAGPSISALRSMIRVLEIKDYEPEHLTAAAQIGLGFRTLFNTPETVAFLQTIYPDKYIDYLPDDAYWKMVLKYCVEGNLQAVMDEFTHVLKESLGLIDVDLTDSAIRIGEEIRQSLSLRASPFAIDEIKLKDRPNVDILSHRIRCRYAQRFGTEKTEDATGRTREVDVRIAFNSPFRPFVLATTSIGQEGLDFHQYCHRVIHWNLPANPVDLEQREGRIHRYKGHVIRRNLADFYNFAAFYKKDMTHKDPWEYLFGKAIEDRPESVNDLVPFWVYEEGGNKIERIIPMLPISREIGHLDRLKRALVAYRSVIGQPRQEELLEYLSEILPKEELLSLTKKIMIDLSPPVIDP